MKKITHVSDVTGEDITDHVEVTVKRAGHGFKIGKTTYFGDTTLDVDVKELPTLLSKITFQKNLQPDIKAFSAPSAAAVASFFKPGEDNQPTPDKVSVERSQCLVESPDLKETE